MRRDSRGRLDGKVAVITGAASGVGNSAVTLFVEEGALVVGADYRGNALRSAHSNSERLHLVDADVRVQKECDRLVHETVERFGTIDILFNNAGATIRGTIDDTDDETWQDAMDVNLLGVFRLCRATVPHMRTNARGSIVNNASITALRGVPGAVAYAAAKGGVVALTRALAIDLASDGIRVNAICPAVIDSPMTWQYLDTLPDPAAEAARLAAKHPLGRFASPLEVAYAALFLASDEAAFITGVALPVDGGRHVFS
jgi:NAD(P)-dependent dehydrogenase (short-subunit alcohol dehydrogenase family)